MAIKINKRLKFLHQFKEGEEVVKMLEHKGAVYIATNYNVYYVANKKLHKIELG